jgi:hypothetical protein
MSPPDHEPTAIEDEADVVPVAEVIRSHVVVRMWDVEACVRQSPGVMAVVFPHAAGEAFEVGVFHGGQNGLTG